MTYDISCDTYTEKHHIIPRSLGGSNDIDNLVRLTAKQHFICHKLLTKMFKIGTNEYYKMLNAFCMMSWCAVEYTHRCKVCSSLYSSIKPKSTYCGSKCSNYFRFKNPKIITLYRDNQYKKVKAQNVPAYKKCGWLPA